MPDLERAQEIKQASGLDAISTTRPQHDAESYIGSRLLQSHLCEQRSQILHANVVQRDNLNELHDLSCSG